MVREYVSVMFDMDGVLADFIYGFRTLARLLYGPDVEVYGTLGQERWDLMEGLTAEQVNEIWGEIKQSDTFWADLPRLCTHDEMARIAALSRDPRYRLRFVSSRPGWLAEDQTKRWLVDTHGVWCPTVVVVPVMDTKATLAQGLGVDYSLEDKAGNAVCIGYVKTIASYLINRPYNQFEHDVLGRPVRRVNTVAEFLREVTRRA